jgi:hypothetical protein
MVAILLELTLVIALTAPGTDDESSVTVTPKKELKDGVIRPNGTIKLRRPAPKHNKPGNWRDGSVIDGQSCLPYLTREHPSKASVLLSILWEMEWFVPCASLVTDIPDHGPLCGGALKYSAEADMLILQLQKTRSLESARQIVPSPALARLRLAMDPSSTSLMMWQERHLRRAAL